MPTRNINLTDHLDQFVEEQVNAGRFHNASEVLRAGLRLLEQQTSEEQEKLSLLRSLAVDVFQDLDQGRGITINGPDELAKFVARIGRQVSEETKARNKRR